MDTTHHDIILDDFIKLELSYLINQATQIRLLIDTAKTDTKRKFYKKKLTTLVASIDKIYKQYQTLVGSHTDTTTPPPVDVQISHYPGNFNDTTSDINNATTTPPSINLQFVYNADNNSTTGV